MSGYAELRAVLQQQEIFQKQPTYYARITLWNLGMLVFGIGLLFRFPQPAVQAINASFLAFVFTQISFLVHDAGHNAIFPEYWKNVLFGRLHAGLVLGMGFSWWCNDHNRHHRYPNQIERDPNVSIPVLAFSEQQARDKRGLCRWLVKYQAWLFLPMTLLEAVSKRRAVLEFLLRRRNLADLALFAAHYVLYFGILVRALPWPSVIMFVVVHQGLYGLYMSLVFAPNHKGMPVLERDSRLGFVERQTATARNVRVHRAFDFWFGGANYQVEHHLFPRISRNKLPEARAIIRNFCERNRVTYHETGFVETYRDILRHLWRISRVLHETRT